MNSPITTDFHIVIFDQIAWQVNPILYFCELINRKKQSIKYESRKFSKHP